MVEKKKTPVKAAPKKPVAKKKTPTKRKSTAKKKVQNKNSFWKALFILGLKLGLVVLEIGRASCRERVFRAV